MWGNGILGLRSPTRNLTDLMSISGAPQSFFYLYSGTRYFQGWRYVPDLEQGEPGDYLTDKLTEKAMEVLDQKADHQPVFLNLWYHSVHTPIDGRPEKVEKYRRKIRQV